jgi:hypothetical protein
MGSGIMVSSISSGGSRDTTGQSDPLDLHLGYQKTKKFYNGHTQEELDDPDVIGIDGKAIQICFMQTFACFPNLTRTIQ